MRLRYCSTCSRMTTFEVRGCTAHCDGCGRRTVLYSSERKPWAGDASKPGVIQDHQK